MDQVDLRAHDHHTGKVPCQLSSGRGSQACSCTVRDSFSPSSGFNLGCFFRILEIYACPDSRLTNAIRAAGGTERMETSPPPMVSVDFTIFQKTQPKHIWVAPECKLWGSLSNLNAARSSLAFYKLQADCQKDRIHLRLCARIHALQRSKGRHFHFQQPEQSRMLNEPALANVRARTQKVVVDMLLTTLPALSLELQSRTCLGNHVHQQVAGRIKDSDGRTVATLRFAVSYCQGFSWFSQEVARVMLSGCPKQGALAAENVPHRTRKRFKTADVCARHESSTPLRKRGPAETAGPAASQRRLTGPSEVPVSQDLPVDVWGPVFDVALGCNAKSAPQLVPTTHELFGQDPHLRDGYPSGLCWA